MSNEVTIPQAIIENKIYLIRGQKVMLDSQLAELYEVETRALNQQVKRNEARFPKDFMFQLNTEEWENLKSQNVTSSWGGRRTLPYVFTEHGVLMLSSVLNSERAMAVNIHIMRVYTKMRELMLTNDDILKKLAALESADKKQGQQIDVIFKYIQQLENNKNQQKEQEGRTKIGFNSDDKK